MILNINIFGKTTTVQPVDFSLPISKAIELAVNDLGYTLGDNQFEIRKEEIILNAGLSPNELGFKDGDTVTLNFPRGLNPDGSPSL